MKPAAILLSFGLLALLVAGEEDEDEPVGRVQRDVRTERFATAIVCGVCHANQEDSGVLRDNLGRGIAPYDLWRSTMMANSARDPFFHAAVAAEVAAAPDRKAEIEAGCLVCHAPMGTHEVRAAGRSGMEMADLWRDFEEEEEDLAAIARDGVSCTLCHQITEEGQGSPKTYDGNFGIGDGKEIFGPHDDQFGLPMNRVTKYWPVEGRHILDSGHCASCHTQTLPAGGFEQATFLEWRNSEFFGRQTCQDCHAPTTSVGGVKIRTRITGTSHEGDLLYVKPREPVGRHIFVGGNTLLPAILRDHADELFVQAIPEAFEATIAATRFQLREQTANIEIEDLHREGDTLHIEISIENLSGHKFPSGHASRRAWLRVRVLDKEGKVVFISGDVDAKGRLVSPLGVLATELAGGPVAGHLAIITSPDQVQVYEAILADADRRRAVASHAATGFLKDNRLLPKGWKADHPDAAATRPVGVGEDPDFKAGGDRVVYRVNVPETLRHYRIEAELLYQPLSARHADELFKVAAPEVKRFRGYFEAADRSPELISAAFLVGDETQ